MRKQNNINVYIGVMVLLLIIVLGIFGFKNFGRTVEVPQVGDGVITETQVKAIGDSGKLLDTKNKNMDIIQTIKKDSGLIIEITRAGTGEPVRTGDIVSLDYRGFFTNGAVFDESYQRGQQFSFTVGGGQVIAGWDEGLLGMKVGEKRRLTVPSSLGYGPNDYGPIPGGSTLVFDIELHKIGK